MINKAPKYAPAPKPSITEDKSFKSNSFFMQDILNKVQRIAQTDKHVVLIGETGVGKKRLAHMIHKSSQRAEGPFHSFYCVDINDAEFKEAFLENIYFHNEHIHLKYDLLEKSNKGILYLDQFSELNSSYMSSLVEFYFHGCNQIFRYNKESSPRLILSISQNKFQVLNNSVIWHDLMQKLDPISIMLPPLRERKEDIKTLIETFLEEARNKDPKWKSIRIDARALEECLQYNWPGNVRQLKNAIMHGAVLSHGQVIESKHLPFSMNWKLPYKTEQYNF